MAESTDAATLIRREDLLAERVHDETLVLDLSADRCTRLNGSGTVLWEALAEPRSLPELARVLESRFALDPESARSDAEAFLRELTARGLIAPAAD